ncbi:MAG: tRNA guanosine(34) transglycosylase Tgt [Candidatus Margulisbacteria bacterium]|nr:tRNA guanosine(34) transglycosylase Tgt [Candidatus Margulisiibacteriota bacterium]
MSYTNDFTFKITKQSHKHKGRLGILHTPHGDIQTPVFMPVGTLGSVKAVLPEMLLAEGTEIILANTYHLFLRPGTEVLEKFQGLHNFMNWHKPILTDSGGFQVFSLSDLNKITDKGVIFKSHLDGSLMEFTPEKVVAIQQSIGADIIMPLDECLPHDADKKRTAVSIKRTFNWEKRCQRYMQENPGRHAQAMFGIIQGGMFPDLRAESAEQLLDLDFFGYSVGGLSVGEDKETLYSLSAETVQHIPVAKPRYLMGVGSPQDVEFAIKQGYDMFDCVLPTRIARHGAFFSKEGNLSIKKKEFEFDSQPLEVGCDCYTCANYSRAYLRHLWRNKEFNAMTLISIHNIRYLIKMIQGIKEQIINE